MSKELNLSQAQIDYLLSPKAIRDKANQLFELTQNGKTNFIFHEDKLNQTVEFVLEVIRKKYPDLNIPFHSRWGHFKAGGIDRVINLNHQIQNEAALEKARIKIDLVVTSVLLDAGAGADWKYFEDSSKTSFNRSEGLGVASYYMFTSGVMSSDKKTLKADQVGLKNVSQDDLIQYFQVSEKNPLVGVSGRVQLLNNLAQAMSHKLIFKEGRPGNIIDYLIEQNGAVIPAPQILRAVLDGLGVIWPGRLSAGGVNLGDVWSHTLLGMKGSFESLVPIHKLSQWMTYSLIEPIEEAGCKVTEVENLTGLAEYRNGGLMLDSGLISLKNNIVSSQSWTPDSDLIIEWRALTIKLLDLIGEQVQAKLQKSPSEFPLAKVLEGGTWWAGRELAAKKRTGGVPPLNIQSDGTVF